MLNPDIKTVLYNNLTNNEVISKLSKCSYIIAMRFHAIIIGLISSSKVLAINYDIKVEKISTEFDLPIIDLKSDFGNNFKKLLIQDTNIINEKLSKKQFNWDGFDKIIKD